MRDLQVVVFTALKAAGILRRSAKYLAAQNVIDKLLAAGKISEVEYQNACCHARDYVK